MLQASVSLVKICTQIQDKGDNHAETSQSVLPNENAFGRITEFNLKLGEKRYLESRYRFLLTSIKGGNINTVIQGTFAHPDLAMAIAMWAHPPFLAEVTGWIQELLLTGRVELGKKKTPEQLDAIFKRRIAEEQAKIQADYLREKLSKELLAIDEDRASKRAREEEDKKDRLPKRLLLHRLLKRLMMQWTSMAFPRMIYKMMMI